MKHFTHKEIFLEENKKFTREKVRAERMFKTEQMTVGKPWSQIQVDYVDLLFTANIRLVFIVNSF